MKMMMMKEPVNRSRLPMAQMLQKLHHDDVAFKTARHYIIIFFVCYFLEIFRFKLRAAS